MGAHALIEMDESASDLSTGIIALSNVAEQAGVNKFTGVYIPSRHMGEMNKKDYLFINSPVKDKFDIFFLENYVKLCNAILALWVSAVTRSWTAKAY